MGLEPLGVGKAVTEQEVGEGAEDYGRDALQQEHPLPARQATLAGGEVIENPAGKRAAEQAGHRNGRHEQRHDSPAAEGRKPLRKVQHHPWKEAGFSGTGKQAQRVEMRGRGHEQQTRGERAPHDHHQRDPAPWAEPGQRQVTRHAAQHVADKENPGPQAVHGFTEFQRIEHLQLGKANVYPVEVIEQVADKDEGDQAQGNALVDGVFIVIAGQCGSGAL